MSQVVQSPGHLNGNPQLLFLLTEAESMVVLNATKAAIWLRVLLKDLGFPQVSTTTLHADNLGCIALPNGTVTHSCAKHIEIHHHFIHECVTNSEIYLQYVSTKEMLANILTKQLLREAFEKYRSALGVIKWECQYNIR
jgi:hypothetical protein